MRIRFALPASQACRSRSPAWMVFPNPTSSAIRSFGGHVPYSRSNARTWWGHGVTAAVASPTRDPPGSMFGACAMNAHTRLLRSIGGGGGAGTGSGSPGSSGGFTSSFTRSGIPSGRKRMRSSRTAFGTSMTSRWSTGLDQSLAKLASSASTRSGSIQLLNTLMLSQFLSQPPAVSLRLPVHAMRFPARSSMIPVFS